MRLEYTSTKFKSIALPGNRSTGIRVSGAGATNDTPYLALK